jgi:hypothetical protein
MLGSILPLIPVSQSLHDGRYIESGHLKQVVVRGATATPKNLITYVHRVRGPKEALFVLAAHLKYLSQSSK